MVFCKYDLSLCKLDNDLSAIENVTGKVKYSTNNLWITISIV